MPSLDLVDAESEVSGNPLYYTFTPAQFELFPKVNKLLRTTFCNLGLWNINDQYPGVTQLNDDSDNWALGQVFIRQNGLNIEWQVSADDNDYVAVISFKKALDNKSIWFGFFLAALVLSALSIYLAILTVFKFRRIKDQNDQFKKIKILTSNYELDISPEFAEVFKAQQADRDFVENKDGAQTSTQRAVEMAVLSGLTPRASGGKDGGAFKIGTTPKGSLTSRSSGGGNMFIATPKNADKQLGSTPRLNIIASLKDTDTRLKND